MTTRNPDGQTGDPVPRPRFPWLFLVAGMCIGFAAFFTHPFCVSLDAPHHLRLARDFFLAFTDAPGYPDWDALVHEGRGSSAFRCVAPLVYLVALFWQLLGMPAFIAVKLTVVTYALLGAWGMRRWMRAIGLGDAAGWGMLLWLAGAPIALHAGFFFFFQNFCAMLLLPVILAGWAEAGVPPDAGHEAHARRFPLVLTLGFGCICWTHLQSAMMSVYICTFLAGYEALATRSARPFRRLLWMTAVGACLAAPHILPFAATIGDIHLNKAMSGMVVGTDTRFVDDPFATGDGRIVPGTRIVRDIVRLLSDKAGAWSAGNVPAGPSRFRPNEMLPWELLQALLLAAFLASAGMALAAFLRGARGGGFPFLLAGSTLLVFTLRITEPLWPLFPGWYSLQFPFRWLFPAHTLIVPAAAGCFRKEAAGLRGYAGYLAAAGMVGVTLLFHLLTAGFDAEGFRLIGEGRGVVLEFAPASCEHPERLSGKAGNPHVPRIASGAGTIDGFEAGFEWARFTVSVTASEGADLRIGTHFDREWRLESTAGPIPLEPERPCGTMKTRIPPGTAAYTLSRAAPPYRNAGWLLALVGLLLAWFGRNSSFRLKDPPPAVDTGR